MEEETPMNRAAVELVSPCEIEIRRTFRAPPAMVWRAWTEPDYVRQWWGLRALRLSECSIDLRVGGRWRWVLESGDGHQVAAFSGEFREIEPGHLLQRTELFEAMPGTDFVTTIRFEPCEDGTLLVSRMLYQSQEHRDGHLQSGMEAGMNETYERLDELLAIRAGAA
jgi:uncharacterized protein YndB with AHSA1/START domain